MGTIKKPKCFPSHCFYMLEKICLISVNLLFISVLFISLLLYISFIYFDILFFYIGQPFLDFFLGGNSSISTCYSL